MKANKLKVIIVMLAIFGLIGAAIYIVYANEQGDKKNSIEEKYEKINMITNFRIGVCNFDNINPHLTQNKDIIQIASLIFEPLLAITADYKIENCLAKEWSRVSGKIYLIKLKEDVKWQDDTEFTSEDVKFTIKEIQKDKKSIYYENVKEIQKAEVVDKYTIRLELGEEIPFFEYQLIFPIISKKQYNNKQIIEAKDIPLGTGKYKISRLDKDIIELEKNEKWHGIENENSNIKTITISIYENMGEVYNSFRLGNIDLVHTENTNYEEYIGSMGYQKKEYAGREYDYLAFNCKNEVLKNKEVRQAIQKIINKQKIVSNVLENHVMVADFPLDYGNYLIEGLELSLISNSVEAKKILEEAEWKYEYGIWSKQIDGITRTLNFNLIVNKENEQRVKVANEIKEQLEAFGIKITVQEITEENYQRILENHQYEVILTGVYNSYSPELTSFLGEENLANYNNEQVNKLLKELNTMASEEMKKAAYKKIVETYQSEVPYIGLYRNQVVVAYGQTVRGDMTPNNYSIFYKFNQWYRQQYSN